MGFRTCPHWRSPPYRTTVLQSELASCMVETVQQDDLRDLPLAKIYAGDLHDQIHGFGDACLYCCVGQFYPGQENVVRKLSQRLHSGVRVDGRQ